ncbi:c-type cytochrome [Thermus oshimai]|nr:c-type cytochrome [Thermus oshimai]
MEMKRFLFLTVPLLGLLGYWALSQYTLPEGLGKDLVLAKCQACHDLGLVARERLSRARWDAVLDEMALQGLKLTPEERAGILDYLATYLGTTPPPVSPAPTQAAKTGAQVYANCMGCHGPEGQGNPPSFPPLTHVGPWAATEGGRTYLLHVLLHGLQGEIRVGEASYNGVMPGFSWLSDEEIALVLNHVVAWKAPQGFKPFTPGEVAQARAKPLSPEEVWRLRP